eukprot:g207.t1
MASSAPETPFVDAPRQNMSAFYHLQERYKRGHHGEVWRATRNSVVGGDQDESANVRGGDVSNAYVIKRMFVEKGKDIWLSGLREVYFGERLRGRSHIARYVEYTSSSEDEEPFSTSNSDTVKGSAYLLPQLWLVFRDEGKSLLDYLYDRVPSGPVVITRPSAFWKAMRTEAGGMDVMRSIWRQTIDAIATLHDLNITHRDIKPGNIIVSRNDDDEEDDDETDEPSFSLRLADFGSAIDTYSIENLYGPLGPSQSEETEAYEPPEVRLHPTRPYWIKDPRTFDMWSAGVLFLETIVGTSHVFELDASGAKGYTTRRKYRTRLREDSPILRGLAAFCIYEEGDKVDPLDIDDDAVGRRDDARGSQSSIARRECGVDIFARMIAEKDPLGVGIEDPWALDLLFRLLRYDPRKRITAAKAKEHAFFKGPYICEDCSRRKGYETLEFALPSLVDEYREAQRRYEEKLKRSADRDARSGIANVMIDDDAKSRPDSFCCPQCGRCFDSPRACDRHMHAREHTKMGRLCLWSSPRVSEAFKNVENELKNVGHWGRCDDEIDAVSIGAGTEDTGAAWCTSRGNRPFMEDYGSSGRIESSSSSSFHEWFGIFDGHNGARSAAFASGEMQRYLRDVAAAASVDAVSFDALPSLIRGALWTIEETLFRERQEIKDESGTTATIVAASKEGLTVVNVGDSTAIACCSRVDDPSSYTVLSVDHTPYLASERMRVERLGGNVTCPKGPEGSTGDDALRSIGGVCRVEGKLAVSRSIGDFHLKPFVSSLSNVNILAPWTGHEKFLIVASDGLWDGLSFAQAVHLVFDVLDGKRQVVSHESVWEAAARGLVEEAYLRSAAVSDNIMVVVVPLSRYVPVELTNADRGR